MKWQDLSPEVQRHCSFSTEVRLRSFPGLRCKRTVRTDVELLIAVRMIFNQNGVAGKHLAVGVHRSSLVELWEFPRSSVVLMLHLQRSGSDAVACASQLQILTA